MQSAPPVPPPATLLDSRQRETDLMVRFCRTRRAQDFERLYRATQVVLLEWIQRLTLQHQGRVDPYEVLQDTYVNIYRYAGTFRADGGQTFRAWSRTVAANVLRRSLRPTALQTQALPTEGNDPTDQKAGPHELASREEERRRLAQAWTMLLMHYAAAAERLSERDRRALELIEVQGCTYAEAGRILKVGPSNMKMIMFRSRKRIRRHIAQAMGLQEEAVPMPTASALREAG